MPAPSWHLSLSFLIIVAVPSLLWTALLYTAARLTGIELPGIAFAAIGMSIAIFLGLLWSVMMINRARYSAE